MGGPEGPDFNKSSYRTHNDRALAQGKNSESSSSITGRKGTIFSRSWFYQQSTATELYGEKKKKQTSPESFLKELAGRECGRGSVVATCICLYLWSGTKSGVLVSCSLIYYFISSPAG